MRMRSILIFCLFLNLLFCYGEKQNCPCSTESLCKPLTTPPRQEIFIFQVETDTWEQYDWEIITTIATFASVNSSMLCNAHASNVRVVIGTSYPVDQLFNSTQRSIYVDSLVKQVQETFTDGVNIDFEDPIPAYSDDVQYLTQLVKEVKEAFQSMPGTQVTFDVAWSPDCIDGRCYDWIGLAQNTDFLVVMGYDLRSQIFGDCVASANSPLDLIYQGLWSFMDDYGINGSQLVLGVPWYGYDYPCLNSQSPNETICDISFVPFRGVNCSDAAGTQLDYATLMNLIDNSTGGRMWSSDLESPWFNYMDGNTVHQVWFDDPESLSIKYQLAKKMGLRGLSMWNADSVYYGDDENNFIKTEQMWDAMDIFLA